MKKVAIYYRVSTERQDFASQQLAVEQWIEELPEDKKPSVIKVFKDEGISGKTVNRPGFQDMLKLPTNMKSTPLSVTNWIVSVGMQLPQSVIY